jgi:hypothetical protein
MNLFQEIKIFISEIGFPVFVACYSLIYIERAMRHLTTALDRLCTLQQEHAHDEKLHHESNQRHP